jgi:hypothetical protein
LYILARLAASALFLALAFSPENLPERVQVSSARANIRENPSRFAKILTRASEGKTFEVTGISSSWYRIRLANGVDGYLSSKLSKPVTGVAVQTENKKVLPPEQPVSKLSPTSIASLSGDDFLIASSALLIFGFLIFALISEWKDWSKPLKIVAIGSLVALVCVAIVVARNIHDQGFKPAFLANYVVAIVLFILTFFGVEQFLEVQRSKSVFGSYLPAIAEELLLNCSRLTRCIAAVNFSLKEGWESIAKVGLLPPTVEQVAWRSFLDSGHYSSLASLKGEPSTSLKKATSEIENMFSKEFLFDSKSRINDERLEAPARGLAFDISFAYQQLKVAVSLLNLDQIKELRAVEIGKCDPQIRYNPVGESQVRFSEAYDAARMFSREATMAIASCCFVFHQIRLLTGEIRRSDTPTFLPREIADRLMSAVPSELRRPSN